VGKVLLDFDGTLAHRPGMWSGCLLDVLDEIAPGHGLAVADLRPGLSRGFPWDDHEVDHRHLATPDLWWAELEPLFHRILLSAGVPPSVVPTAVSRVRSHYCDPTRFSLFADTVDALGRLKNGGWSLVILSNHVPELPSIVDGLGLRPLIDEVFTSGATGYEKPHPEAFALALGEESPSRCFMVGDNPEADVLGAERIGLPGILVRSESAAVKRSVPDLSAAARLILSR
jgi:putative hydrolase of the HAD superfamily